MTNQLYGTSPIKHAIGMRAKCDTGKLLTSKAYGNAVEKDSAAQGSNRARPNMKGICA